MENLNGGILFAVLYSIQNNKNLLKAMQKESQITSNLDSITSNRSLNEIINSEPLFKSNIIKELEL